jgi:hypothetical protein
MGWNKTVSFLKIIDEYFPVVAAVFIKIKGGC